MHEKEGEINIPDEEKWSLGRKTLGKEVWSKRERFWEVKSQQESREIEKNEPEIAWILYIEPFKSRQNESCREVSRFKLRQMHLSNSYPEVSIAKTGSMDRRVIKHLSRRQKLSRWIEELSRSYRDCDKKKLKSLIDSLAIERCREAVEIA